MADRGLTNPGPGLVEFDPGRATAVAGLTTAFGLAVFDPGGATAAAITGIRFPSLKIS